MTWGVASSVSSAGEKACIEASDSAAVDRRNPAARSTLSGSPRKRDGGLRVGSGKSTSPSPAGDPDSVTAGGVSLGSNDSPGCSSRADDGIVSNARGGIILRAEREVVLSDGIGSDEGETSPLAEEAIGGAPCGR